METKPGLIKDFYDFFKKNMWVADFEPCWACSNLLDDLIPLEKIPAFVTLGMNKSHTVFAIWLLAQEQNLEDQPVVWMDSEGEPNEVFAVNFQAFLAMLPYDTASWYNQISAWTMYLENPNTYQHVLEKYNSPSLYKEQMTAAAKRYQGHQAFLNWIVARHITTSENPFMDIGKAIQSHPRLSVWLASS